MVDRQPQLYLAPMVRISTLPFRLMCLKYGATKVFTPELIDKAIISSIKNYDPVSEITTFSSPNSNTIVWSTHPSEKNQLVLQLGTSDPDLALEAFIKVKDYISEINLNAGCPKRFSIQAGMGAALLKTPKLMIEILNRLGDECCKNSRNKIPLSVKLRLLSSAGNEYSNTSSILEDLKISTSNFFTLLAGNVSHLDYILVHSRRVTDRTEAVPAFWDVWEYLLKNTKVPLVANGDFLSPLHIEMFWNRYKEFPMLKALLIARGAQTNPTIFCPFSQPPREMVDSYDVCREFSALAQKFAPSSFTHVKFALMQMHPKPLEKYDSGQILLHSVNWGSLSSAFLKLSN